MLRHAFTAALAAIVLSLAVGAPGALAQEEDEEDNEFSRRTPTDFASTLPRKDIGGVFSAAGDVETVVQLDNILGSGPNYSPFSNLFSESELRGSLGITGWFTVNGLLRMEQVYDEPESSGVFANQAMYVQRLFGVINLTPVYLYGGKIHPRFGMAWYATPGLYGSDFAEDYEIEEKLGFGARVDFEALGTHRITAEAFQTDTSFLATNLLPGPGPGDPRSTRQVRASFAQGGVSNTGTFESFALAFSSRRHFGLQGLATNLGWAKLKASPFDQWDQYSGVAGASWYFKVVDRITLQPLAEFATVTGQSGVDRNVDYLTLAATLRLGTNWAVGVHTTQRYVRDYAANSFYTDSLAGVGVKYDIGDVVKDRLPWLDGVSLIAGYRYDRKIGVDRDTIGFQVRYERNL